ncbi:MAG: tRNA (N6-isopentenyl adenosine(37)-C2)-methylthiotransferase MiaB [Candidatus Moranbacteria bacterium]|nr:tRNA (N6-isopentenyl adenosine(37)-C2)-methylthiotransferase MiaB [Candidatus Moranbacteria bacterium]
MSTYYIKTFGCQMNHSDSERMASFLEKLHLEPTSKINEADLVIFNTCGVRQMAENRIYGQVRNLKRNKSEVKIILTGCISQRKDVQRRMKDKIDLFFSINDFSKFENWLNENLKFKISPQKDNALSGENISYLSINPKYSNKYQAYVPIMTGCNNFCSYCVVPHARGREVSRPSEEVLAEIRELVKKGYKQITLLGQNVNSYKSPSDAMSFSELLRKVNDLKGDFWIQFVSSHPKDMSDELIEALTSLSKVCENVHLPVQAGDDEVLKNMNRRYTQKHYLGLIEKIKKGFEKNKPEKIYSITSDIIVGFPGETVSQLEESASVMKKCEFDMVFFGQFSPRPETVAWDMKDDVSDEEKVRREKYLNEILKKTSHKNNKKYVGGVFDVIIEREKSGFYFGKTRTLKNVKVAIPANCHPELDSGSRDIIGTIQKVKITKANVWSLFGELV